MCRRDRRFNQSRDDREASLPASEPVAAPPTTPLVEAPKPDTLSSLESADTESGARPETGAAQSGLDAPVANPGSAPQVAAQTEAPVQPSAQASAPQAPQAEPELSISTEPAQPQPPAVETGDSAFAEPTEPKVEPAAAAPDEAVAQAPDPEPAPSPAPDVQSDAPVEPQAPQVVAENSAIPAPRQAEEPQPVEMASKPAEPATPENTPAVAPPPEPQAEPEPEPTPTAAQQTQETADDTMPPEPVKKPEVAAVDPKPEAAPSVEAAPAPQPDPEPAPPPVIAVEPEVQPAPETTVEGPVIRIGKPASNLKTLGTGVQTSRLPSVRSQSGGASDAPADDAVALPASAGDASALPPVKRFASAFEGSDNKPKMSIVLIDEGGGPVGIEALTSFPYPLSFAVDTSREDAAEKMAIYRAAGFEVLAMVALPEGAKPEDVEVAMPVLLEKVPEAVGVMEAPGDGIQFDRRVSDQVAQILADTGHGLLLYPKGLNTAQKLAAKNGVPSSVIFRDVDGKGQKSGAIRRFLNYGALNAGNEGGVVMVGRLRPDTVTALLLWGLEDRARQITLAPVSQLLQVQN